MNYIMLDNIVEELIDDLDEYFREIWNDDPDSIPSVKDIEDAVLNEIKTEVLPQIPGLIDKWFCQEENHD